MHPKPPHHPLLFPTLRLHRPLLFSIYTPPHFILELFLFRYPMHPSSPSSLPHLTPLLLMHPPSLPHPTPHCPILFPVPYTPQHLTSSLSLLHPTQLSPFSSPSHSPHPPSLPHPPFPLLFPSHPISLHFSPFSSPSHHISPLSLPHPTPLIPPFSSPSHSPSPPFSSPPHSPSPPFPSPPHPTSPHFSSPPNPTHPTLPFPSHALNRTVSTLSHFNFSSFP
ncbi:hypothetical protein Pcinc_030099 [Petrolisthes cinctipes]|uniref:Uncharacterized protein n=1 Tax=Petrolisthes cinctipes TaxID=88211 RepID=A0AAE1K6T3_PETCI|nr:hypothetical protein Pcinc_030099 [Petrolisthes cinctipes]